MSIYSIYFSPTGGTKKVMEILAASWPDDAIIIDLCSRDQDLSAHCFGPEDICLIGVPSYGGRVPAIALERLAALKADNSAAVLAVTYGNRAYDDTLLELQETVKGCGFRICGAVAAVTEHSIMHQYGTARPDAQDQEQLQRFSCEIMAALSSPENKGVLSLPGNSAYREYKGVPLKPKAGKNCTGCGVCAALCPAGAIPPDKPEQTLNDTCISCMRCISVCPDKARSLNKVMLLAAGQSLKAVCSERKENQLFLAE